MLFRKFAADFAHKYKMPPIKLSDDAVNYLMHYRWSGNIRQLRNSAEQISVLEANRDISLAALKSYFPSTESNSLQVVGEKKSTSDFSNEREILYKVLFDMKSDLTDLKKLTLELMQNGTAKVQENNKSLIQKIYGNSEEKNTIFEQESKIKVLPEEEEIEQEEFDDDDDDFNNNYLYAETIDETETLSLEAKEIELIKKSLEKNKGKRKAAADELGISERTLYRKIKQFDL